MSNNIDLLHVADAVAREKGIEREEVLNAMELAIQKAGRTKYGYELDIRANINRKTGEIQLARYQEVVEIVEDESRQISLKHAHKQKSDLQVGEFLIDPLPPIDFGRVAAQTARQVIVQRVREAERDKQYNEYKDRAGEVINGLVKRVEFGNVVIDMGRTEALLRRDGLIGRETFKNGDRVRAIISEVKRDNYGPQVLLSRSSSAFLMALFAQEVPEIYDGNVIIKAAARDPGSRAKVAVYAKDSSIDPVGSCVGVRGSRVQAIVNELQGEKIDIVLWSPDIATFVVNSLAPADVVRVVVEEESKKLDVVVGDDQLSIAIGRRGQNIRLASQLVGWNINISTESEDDQKRSQETENISRLFVHALDVDDVLARLLIAEGFTTIEDVAFVDCADLTAIEGFDGIIAAELQERAMVYLKNSDDQDMELLHSQGMTQDLLTFSELSVAMLKVLCAKNIKSLDDFADLSGDEVVDIFRQFKVSLDQANDIVMLARKHWFADDASATSAQPDFQ